MMRVMAGDIYGSTLSVFKTALCMLLVLFVLIVYKL